VKLTVQVVLETDDAQDPAVVCDVFTLERGPLTADTVELRLAEANDLLAAVQQTLVAEQARAGPPATIRPTCTARSNGHRPASTPPWPPCPTCPSAAASASSTARRSPGSTCRPAAHPRPSP
jgi:hypothetical protein